MLDRKLIERIAGALLIDEGLVEKDWYIVRAISVIANIDHGDTIPVFSGGTSLSKGWGLIKRFSEDIDFKVFIKESGSAASRSKRRAFRGKVLSELTANQFELDGESRSGNQSNFFSANLIYPSLFANGFGLRPHLRVEMSFQSPGPALNPINRPIRSLLAEAQKKPPEISSFPCIDPIETAADKLSALAWRVCSRKRGAEDDDPTIVRHLHDLAALKKKITEKPLFVELVKKIAADDTGRGGVSVPVNPTERFTMMLNCLRDDSLWLSEYEYFVKYMSFAESDEKITFAEAFSNLVQLVALISY